MVVVDVLRRFNRSYTQRIGVLDDSYLDTGRPLGPSRLLYEIDAAGSAVLELRRRLGLDSGYVSRLLRQLEGERLVEVLTDPHDRRQRVVRLTALGNAERAKLEQRSEDLAQQLLAPLSDRQRSDLAVALVTVDRLLRAATVEFDLVEPRSPHARRAIGEYFSELDRRFPQGFDADLARHEEAEAEAFSAPDGAFVVIRSDDAPIGCGGVQLLRTRSGPSSLDGPLPSAPPVTDGADRTTTAEIKRMWIHPDWRSLGLGRRLVEHLEQLAVDRGHARVVLDTNDALTEAIAMYAAMGYEPTTRYNDNPYAQRWFAKAL